MNRICQKNISFTEAEIEIIEKKASDMHMSFQEFIRYLALGKYQEKNITKNFYEKLKEKEEQLRKASVKEFEEIVKECAQYDWE